MCVTPVLQRHSSQAHPSTSKLERVTPREAQQTEEHRVGHKG